MIKDTWIGLICLILLTLVIVVVILKTELRVDIAWKREAVKQGHAEWTADEDGKVVWKWKETK